MRMRPSRSSKHEIPKEWNIGMNKVMSSLLFVLILSVLQIPTIAFASANADSEGYDMRIRLNKTLSSRFSRIDDKFTATVVDIGPFNQAKFFGHIEDIKQSGRFKVQLKCTFHSTASAYQVARHTQSVLTSSACTTCALASRWMPRAVSKPADGVRKR